jgi:hypothetical protein
MVATPPKSTEARERQSMKAPSPMVVTLPKFIEVMEEQPAKALVPMVATLLGILIDPKANFVGQTRPGFGVGFTKPHCVKKPP